MSRPPVVKSTNIPGLLEIKLAVIEDERGWFKENYHRHHLANRGLSNFEPVQNNVSFNSEQGVTRGLHAEPWEKYISVLSGLVMGAWVDLRPGSNFGRVETRMMTTKNAMFVPRGVANGYQTLSENVVYSYLVNDHWRPDIHYPAVDLFDPELAINWRIPKEQAIVSAKDLANPLLRQLVTICRPDELES